MRKNIPVLITLLSVAIGVGGISFGIKANNLKNLAEQEAKALRDQMALSAEVTTLAEPENESLVTMTEATADTNDVSSMEAQLAAQAAELERLRAEVADRQNRPPRESFQDRMARMKEEEPERYAEMVQRRTEWQEEMRYEQANRLATFMDFDTSNMTPEELENHNLLVEKLSGIWEQTGSFDPEQPPDREAWGQIRETIREVSALMDGERTVMFKQLGTDVGLSGSDAEEFAAYADSIIQSTTLRGPRGNRGPRGGN